MSRPKGFKAEAFEIMQYFYRTAHDPLVRCLIRLDGHIDEDTLKRAVTLSAKATPLIFCRFNDKARRPRWEAAGYTAEDALHMQDVEGEQAGYEERILASMTVDIFREPQLKILIARGEAADTLCIIINHMVCDGGGFKEYLVLLSNLYGKCQADAAYDEDLKPTPRGMGQLFSRMTPMDELLILTEKDELGKQRNGLVYRLEGAADSPFIALRTIAPERLAAMRARAKALGATVNDLLLAAYARALSRETGERTLTIPCPVDLRKYLPAGQPRICNLTSNLICEVELVPGEPFDATLQKVAAQMARQKESNACLKGPLLYYMLFPLVPFRTLRKNFSRLFTIPMTSFTNLGILDGKRLRFAAIGITEAYMTAAIKRVPYFQVTASTFEGSCTLTCNLHGTAEDRENIERFLESMELELTEEKERQ